MCCVITLIVDLTVQLGLLGESCIDLNHKEKLLLEIYFTFIQDLVYMFRVYKLGILRIRKLFVSLRLIFYSSHRF
jgi:hypothetical protein